MDSTESGIDTGSDLDYSVDRDWLLQHLVTYTNQTKDFTQPITLWIGGGVISGLLVSGEKFFEAYSEEFSSRFTPEAAKVTRATLRQIGSRYYEDDERPNSRDTVYIHLLDAHFWSPSGCIPSGADSGVTWRGRISQVIGFSLGSFKHAT
ncbi:gas vesicle protein [Pseudomonas fulva]|uniref:gas vesicle protein n=1 Tax=Pseudomonas fulva TaxID=47880 RepID=UPI0018AC3973|nr:gas vesicle protein [Pseudomonas fulva]MBF8676224.1 gas vesicle protein [Pseudomonas fulva]MBF8698612.1 gas vesicle protein [Pseudomonas fulva]